VLYQRFPNKHDLFFAAMVPSAPDVDAILGEIAMPVETYLEGVAMRVLAYFEETHPTVMQLMAHPEFDAKVMGKLHERVLSKRLVEGIAGRLDELKARGAVGQVDVTASAQAIVASLHSFVMFHVMSGASLGRRAGHLVPKIIDVFWTGLAPRK
jgi:AcrR family transcriptional regulator